MDTSITTDWFELLADDCKAIITEAVFTSRWALVEGNWLLGQRIRADENNIKPIGITKVLQDLAVKVNISFRSAWYAVQLYDKYPDIDKLPEGKNISMNKLITKYLPETSAKEKEFDEKLELKNHCPRCGYEW